MATQITETPAVITQATGKQWAVPSRTRVGMTHVVRKVNGSLQCSCEAALNGRSCWHVAEIARIENERMRWNRVRSKAQTETQRPVISDEMRELGLSLIMGKRT